MRIDSVDLTAALSPSPTAPAKNADPRSQPPPTSSAVAIPVPAAPQRDVSITVDDSQHIIYRFVDKQTGDLVQQLPPEELLRVMRNIGELLQESRQKLNMTM